MITYGLLEGLDTTMIPPPLILSFMAARGALASRSQSMDIFWDNAGKLECASAKQAKAARAILNRKLAPNAMRFMENRCSAGGI